MYELFCRPHPFQCMTKQVGMILRFCFMHNYLLCASVLTRLLGSTEVYHVLGFKCNTSTCIEYTYINFFFFFLIPMLENLLWLLQQELQFLYHQGQIQCLNMGKREGIYGKRGSWHCSVRGFSVRVILSVEELSVWKWLLNISLFRAFLICLAHLGNIAAHWIWNWILNMSLLYKLT